MKKMDDRQKETVFIWVFGLAMNIVALFGVWVGLDYLYKGQAQIAGAIFALSFVFWLVSVEFGKRMIRNLVIARYIKSKKKGEKFKP